MAPLGPRPGAGGAFRFSRRPGRRGSNGGPSGPPGGAAPASGGSARSQTAASPEGLDLGLSILGNRVVIPPDQARGSGWEGFLLPGSSSDPERNGQWGLTAGGAGSPPEKQGSNLLRCSRERLLAGGPPLGSWASPHNTARRAYGHWACCHGPHPPKRMRSRFLLHVRGSYDGLPGPRSSPGLHGGDGVTMPSCARAGRAPSGSGRPSGLSPGSKSWLHLSAPSARWPGTAPSPSLGRLRAPRHGRGRAGEALRLSRNQSLPTSHGPGRRRRVLQSLRVGS